MTDTPVQDQAARDAAARVAEYEHGWSSDIDTEFAPKGLSEDIVRFISGKKSEPEWMLEWRLKAYRQWLTMTPPDWAKLNVPPIDYQDAYYYAAPRVKQELASLDEVDPEILRVYEKLGIPIAEQEMLANVTGARKIAVECSTAFPSPPPSARSWRRRGSSSARSARRSATILSWCGNGWARSCRCTTIISRH
jgi:Fe-S cluster assembly protein SufB